MRALIIPDLHHHTANADHWLQTVPHDRVIFLGDYFDDFHDDATDARATATWLRRRMDTTDDIFLLGNHDAAYLPPQNDALLCPGYTRAKARAVREVLQAEHWQRLRLAHLEQGWLCSHAGFHPSWAKPATAEGFLQLGDAALTLAARGGMHPLLGAGQDRGGDQAVGGVLWMDWSSLTPIAGVNQIVGHTPGHRVRARHGTDSANYCLDVRNAAAAGLLADGQLTLFGPGAALLEAR